MTTASRDATRALDEVAELFCRALAHAGDDADEVNRLLDTAAAVLERAGPAIAAARGGANEDAVHQAAERARHSREQLAQALGLELGRISDELSRLNAGSAATTGYASRAETGSSAGLDRVG